MNAVLHERVLAHDARLQIVHGDITVEAVDAIVNAANEQLMHGGGVAAIIARKGGPVITRESREWVRRHGPVTHDEPAYTSGGELPARYVIHAVGPVWGSGDEDTKLAATVTGSLRRAENLGLRSIAFPAISTGIFGFPKQRAARIILGAIDDYVAGHSTTGVQIVRLTLFDRPTLDAFLEAFRERYPDSGSISVGSG